jgi:hypothetical protein
MNINSHICPVIKETCGFLTVRRLVTWWAQLAFCSGELSKLEKGVARPAPEQRHMRSIKTICNSSNIFQCSNRDVCQTCNNSQIAYDKIWGEELDSDKKRVHHLHLELERIAQSAYLGAGIVLSETLFQTDPLKGRYISSHVITSSPCILGICRFCILWILRLFAFASVFVLLSSSEGTNIRVVSYETGARCLFAPPIRHDTPCLFCTGWCGFLIGNALWAVCQKKLTTARCSKKVGPDIVWQTAPCFHNMFVTSSRQMFLAQPSTRCLVQSGTSGRASFDFPHLERHMSIGFLPASCGTSVVLHTARTACFFMQFLHFSLCLCHEKNDPSSCKVWQWFDILNAKFPVSWPRDCRRIWFPIQPWVLTHCIDHIGLNSWDSPRHPRWFVRLIGAAWSFRMHANILMATCGHNLFVVASHDNATNHTNNPCSWNELTEIL